MPSPILKNPIVVIWLVGMFICGFLSVFKKKGNNGKGGNGSEKDKRSSD